MGADTVIKAQARQALYNIYRKVPRDHAFDHYHTCFRSKVANAPDYIRLASHFLCLHHAPPLYVSSPYCRQ
jgi:hypothetical protein